MKSTGLFGKNSGRVGGVVYSNYRGQQVVRSYQPQVKNPNTKGQVAQRAKFKLVSQVGASLGKEIRASFTPYVATESARNAWVRDMLKKTSYERNQATLPIEEVILTNSKVLGFAEIEGEGRTVLGILSDSFSVAAKVRVIVIGYSDGGEIVPLQSAEASARATEGGLEWSVQLMNTNLAGYSNIRALVFAYEPESNGTSSSYEDYEVLGDEATLEDFLKVYSGKIRFSATENIALPQNV